jgi:hypothetical protein
LSPHSSSSSPDREKANALEKKVTNPAPAADAAAAPAPVLVETTAIVVGLSCRSAHISLLLRTNSESLFVLPPMQLLRFIYRNGPNSTEGTRLEIDSGPPSRQYRHCRS